MAPGRGAGQAEKAAPGRGAERSGDGTQRKGSVGKKMDVEIFIGTVMCGWSKREP